jgi:hypothetical protein
MSYAGPIGSPRCGWCKPKPHVSGSAIFRSDRRKTKCGFLARLTLIPASAGKFPELCYLKKQAAPVTVGPHAEIFLPPSWRCSRS